MKNLFDGAEIISAYTRAQAIEDGVLVDVTSTAKEAGIKYPVALTRAVWSQYVEIPEGVQCQDEAGRLWDILHMFRLHANGTLQPKVRRSASAFCYELRVSMDHRHPRRVLLKALCGPGDDAAPVITRIDVVSSIPAAAVPMSGIQLI
jgi:hypothetical protein